MSNLDSLHRRVDKLLAQECERREAIIGPSERQVVLQLPIKDGQFPLAYEQTHLGGIIQFYVPEHRQEEEL